MTARLRSGGAVRPAELKLPLALAAGVLALELGLQLLDFGAYGLRVGFLDSADEWSYSHVLATLAFAAGTVAGVIATRRGTRPGAAWIGVGSVFGVLFLDNVTRAHEHVPAWPVLYAPLLGALAVCLAVVARGTDRRPFVLAGLGLLFASLAIHVGGPTAIRALGWTPDGWAYQVKVALKEGSELAGWLLVVPAALRLARQGRR
jgi:hypothetical protein